MGITTPNINIYIPSAGEKNYDQSFLAGMLNIDQHDHSGAPGKGLPIGSTSIADGSVTYQKLANNVVDTTTGLGFSLSKPNQIVTTGILNSLNAASTVGFVIKNGTNASTVSFQNTSTITWTNADGTGGNPSANFNISGISPLGVANGGTGLTSMSAYQLLTGGTTSTGPVQQVASTGTAGQFLVSNGPGALPGFQSQFVVNNVKMVLNAAQYNGLNSTGGYLQILPAPGANQLIILYSSWAKLTIATTNFSGSGVLGFYYQSSGPTYTLSSLQYSAKFTDVVNSYYDAYSVQTGPGQFSTPALIVNTPVYIGLNSPNTAAAGNTVTLNLQYSILDFS